MEKNYIYATNHACQVFSKETEYAIRSLVFIRTQNERGLWPGVAEIAQETGSPPFFTAKILNRLVRLGFIGSKKGRNGGFYFDPEKPDLLLKDCIVAIEGEGLFTGCGFGLKQCDEKNPCPLHDRYAAIRNSLNDLVSQETIGSLAGKRSHSSQG